MSYKVIRAGESRSFPESHAFIESANVSGDAWVYLGVNAGQHFSRERADSSRAEFVLIELENECLGSYVEEAATVEKRSQSSKAFGFARFRLGKSDPSNLIELVVPAKPDADAMAAARKIFEDAGFIVAVCGDFPGRIVNRLVRPYYNAALRRLDEKLATASDMDMTLRMGLGYPEGPIELLERTGLDEHFKVTLALYEALGDSAYAPARRATNAFNRSKLGD
ncbi:3-hydroxyacyl-CoA dehydrogenase [Paraburkholderia dipogonis]|uniref:3-hydroxyacyl-CoA dehydrogenase n=1 Tax=Paraburkholderia dipogonis TaxID=1211383 RepID=A0A4Y8MWQ6_9BURK|nr:3-hydroxyacyl-CoA dehydrogenase family protein [Paraburkholderia dipogonis]TFE41976.1 3-hydroxyacyl-CoA dehydrogenase [Paraburkholderia dipogonis]